MNRNFYSSNIKQNHILVFVLSSSILLIGGILSFVSITIVEAIFAQNNSNSSVPLINYTLSTETSNISLGKPFFVEIGMFTDRTEIGQNKTEFIFTSNGTLEGNIKVIGNGTFITSPLEGNKMYIEGTEQVKTLLENETANVDYIFIEDISEDGNPVSAGYSIWKTNSTGVLAPFDNLFTISKGEVDFAGNFINKEWRWN